MSLKLSDAIKAMENGLKSLTSQRDQYYEKKKEYEKTVDKLNDEINARRKCLNAMIELQTILGNEETIKFVIPSEY